MRMISFVLAAGLISMAGLPVVAQQQKPWEKINTPKLHDFKPQIPKKIVLQNGIVIFLQEDHELPFVSGYVLIPGGSRDEDPAKIGLVDLYGQAWRNSGTQKLDGDAMDDLLEAKAASISSGGSEDSTFLSWDSLKGDSDQVFSMAMDLLLHPQFRAEKLHLAQQQEATSITRRNDDASGIATREAIRLVYGVTSPYGRQPELATIGAVTVKDLEAWHDKSIAGKLIFAISGDFDSAAMETKMRRVLETLPQTKATPVRHDTFSAPKQSIFFIDKPDVNQSNVEVVGLGTDRHNPDLATLVVMNQIFGGGFGSRLFQKIRTDMGLAYDVSGSYGLTWDHPGLFEISLSTKSASTVEATRAVLDEVEKLRTTPFTDIELSRAKEQLLNSFLFRYDTRDKVLNARVQLEFYGYPENYLETYKANIEKVTVADLQRVARQYIDPTKLDVLVVGSKTEIQPPLDKVGLGSAKSIDITIPMPQKSGSPGAGD
jgi:zinc protease